MLIKLIKRLINYCKHNPRCLKIGINLYPPYLGAGIKVKKISQDFKHIEVEMPLTWYNRNYVGTHFGGSLYSMTDPFYMLMLINILGPKYVVWDQGATIYFKKPGTGTVKATFTITEEQIRDIIEKTKNGEPYRPRFKVEVKNQQGEVVAEVEKVLYIRRKNEA